MRVRVLPGRMYAYPDVTVVCGKPKLADDRQDNPAVIFEVLSPSTETYDRGIKLQRYLAIETLKDYILVEQDKIRVEHYARGIAGAWTVRAYELLDDQLKLYFVGVSLTLARIYEGVEIPPPAA